MSNRGSHLIVWVPPQTRTEYQQRLLRGIAHYRNTHHSWELTFGPSLLPEQPPESVIGAFLWSSETENLISFATKLPCVQLSNSDEHRHVFAVTADDTMVGIRAAEHFLERSFRTFAYLGSEKTCYSVERCEAFRREILRHQPDASFSSHLFRGIQDTIDQGGVELLLNTLRKQPPPWAVFCADDWWARMLLQECRKDDVMVPGELSVLGVNNETYVCEFSNTPVSSIDIPAEKIGYQAAQVLDGLIHGQTPQTLHQRIPIERIVSRVSTDIHAVSDPVVSKALFLLNNRLEQSVDIQEVARECGVSRRMLERRFRNTLNTSPHKRLTQFRVDRAKSLLRSTRWPLGRIAAECGFKEQKYLSVRFKELEGMPPLQWRKQEVSPS